MAEFDPFDKNSWYFGTLSREETNTTLQAERDTGVFLVRDSTSIKGDFVLCVKEDTKISHYIINKIQSGGAMRFRIGDLEFPSLPELLQFYQAHYLDSTTLVKPAQRQRYIAKYKFAGRDPDDLPFDKFEILTLVRKDEDQWWTMCNSRGQAGLVPAPYIERFNGDESQRLAQGSTASSRTDQMSPPKQPSIQSSSQPSYDCPTLYATLPETPVQRQRTLPARAQVIRNRNPSAYDSTALTLRIGEVVLVTAMHLSGQWEGQINGVSGFFPFTHVKFIDEGDEITGNT